MIQVMVDDQAHFVAPTQILALTPGTAVTNPFHKIRERATGCPVHVVYMGIHGDDTLLGKKKGFQLW